MTRYRKLPVEVDAFKWTADEHQTDDPICIVEALRSGEAKIYPPTNLNGSKMVIQTLEGAMTANVGDYIIRGTKGEIYPCSPISSKAFMRRLNDGCC